MGGGMHFLMQKGFHPLNFQNQKAKFLAEQKAADEAKRQKEAQKEYEQEQDTFRNRILATRDRKEMEKLSAAESVSFMYAPPPGLKAAEERDRQSGASASSSFSTFSGAEAVQGTPFMVLKGKANPTLTLAGIAADEEAKKKANEEAEKKRRITSMPPVPVPLLSKPVDEVGEEKQREHALKVLEMQRQQKEKQHADKEQKQQDRRKLKQDEKFEILKNAPKEGAFMKDMQINYRPFGVELRNVRCVRCNQWGHTASDKTCPMAGPSVLDAERQLREDPMMAMLSEQQQQEQLKPSIKGADDDLILAGITADSGEAIEEEREQRMVFRKATAHGKYSVSDANQQMIRDEDADGEEEKLRAELESQKRDKKDKNEKKGEEDDTAAMKARLKELKKQLKEEKKKSRRRSRSRSRSVSSSESEEERDRRHRHHKSGSDKRRRSRSRSRSADRYREKEKERERERDKNRHHSSSSSSKHHERDDRDHKQKRSKREEEDRHRR